MVLLKSNSFYLFIIIILLWVLRLFLEYVTDLEPETGDSKGKHFDLPQAVCIFHLYGGSSTCPRVSKK